MKTLVIGGLAALAVGGVAMAQDGQRGSRAADGDGDGRISQAEFVAGALARFDSRDANQDGVVSAEEVQSARTARHDAFRDERFARLDADGDGAISRTEFGAETERGGHRRHWGRGDGDRAGGERWGDGDGSTRAEAQARAGEMFSRMDSNNDGFLTQEDRQGRRGGHHGGRRGAQTE